MITLNRIIIKDYLSIESAEIEVKNGSWLIIGSNESEGSSNGAGKSAILDAITYATYGRTIRKINKSDLVSYWASSTDVTTEWEVDGILYTIQRGHKRKGGSYLNIICDETLSFPNQNDAQKFIDDLLGMDFDIFCRTVLISQSLYSLFAESSPADKVRLIEQVLNWEYFDKAQKIVGRYEDRAQKIIDRIDVKIRTSASESRRTEGDINEKETLLESSKKRVEASRKKVREDVERIEGEISTLMGKKEYIESKLGENTKKVGEFNILVNQHDQAIKQFGKQIDDLRRDINNVNDYIGEDCPYCGRDLDEDTCGSIEKYKQGLIDKIAKEMDISALARIDSNDERLHYLDTGKRFQTELNEIDAEIKEITSSKPEEVNDGEVAILEDAVKRLKSDQVRWQRKAKFFEGWEDVVAKNLKVFQFWKKGFSPSGVRNIMLARVIDHLSVRATNYARYLFSEDVSVELSGIKVLSSGGERPSLNIRVVLDGEDRDYNALSGGQRRRVDISVIFALRDIVQGQRRIGILLLDEALDHLDEDGANNLMPLLESMSKNSTVMLVTHRKDFSDMEWDHTLKVKRINGRAKVEVVSG